MAKQGHPLYSSKDPYSAETDARGISPAVFAPTSYMGAADYITTQQEAIADGRGLGGSGAVGFVTIWTGPGTTGIDSGFKYDTATDVFTVTGRIQLTSLTGSENTLIGASAGAALTSGIRNTALGASALSSDLSGSRNTAIGAQALQLNTGADNTALGYQALNSNTSGARNTAVGVGAIAINSTGGDNTAVGYGALGVHESGSNNVGIGLSAMSANTSGSSNTAVGANAFTSSTTTNQSTAIGANSLASSTAADNTAVGYSAGTTITTGASNTFLGSGADATSNSLTNATAIGMNASVNASNKLVLGNTSVTLVYTTGSYVVGANGWTMSATAATGLTAQGNHRFAHGTSALATTATEGFFHMQTCAGTPTGVPASIPTGQAPFVLDTANDRVYFYYDDGGGAGWHYVARTA